MTANQTKDGPLWEVSHKAEAENDFVKLVLREEAGALPGFLFLQPEEAVDIATELLRYAKIARNCHADYLKSKGTKP